MKRRPIDIVSEVVDLIGRCLSKTPISRIPGIGTAYAKLKNSIERRQYETITVPEKIYYRGKSLYVFPDSQWARRIYINEDYSDDEYESRIFRKNIAEGDTVFDIGAFIGTHSLMMRELVGEGGKVYAFEPQPECVDLIQRTFRENKFENCTVTNAAVGSQETTVTLQTSRRGDATSNVVGSDPWDRHEESVDVDMIRLDDYLNRTNIETVDFMKVDVQGAGLEVIKGLGERIRDVKTIYMEIHSKYIDRPEETVEEVFQILSEHGEIIRTDTDERVSVETPEQIIFNQHHPDILWSQQ